MTLEEIQTIIIDLLAAEAGRDRDELLAELEASGRELPCDSVLAAEVLGEVEHRCGVRLQMTPRTAAAMRSVQAYAQAVLAVTDGIDEGPTVVVSGSGAGGTA